ncbi:MAG: hypothetical protein IJ289_07225 [Clostridia bacterium]|nr:hypothetical protein [Clostridia bacterium]
MSKIISFFMAIIYAIQMFFMGLFPSDDALDIIQPENTVPYYVNGESENGLLRFGVVGDDNLFAPGEEINVIIECRDENLGGDKAKVTVESEQADMDRQGFIVFDTDNPYSTFTFTSETNGIYTVKLTLTDKTIYSFNIGILPRNEQADDGFYYGIQPYITRAYCWGEGFQLPGFNAEESVDMILDTADYLGINLVREDSVGWGSMQSEAFGDVKFTAQDLLVDKVNEHGMKYNWILGFNAGKWSVAEKYKDSYDEATGWTYPPNEEIWLDFAAKTAEHYSDNTDILWEIWNEPNWAFFKGTAEEYFSLLEKTATVLKNQNPDFYVYSGGLAVAEKDTNLPYYEKSAELINKKLLDNFGYHNHDGLDNYYNYMQSMLGLTDKAGLLTGGINSESGVGGTDAATIACKALYTRSTGADGFVSFSFRKTVTPENDVNDFAFFNEYLQPDAAVIAYATVIRFLGNAEFVSNLSDEKDLVIDEYSKDGKAIKVYYSLGNTTKTTAPDGSYTAYDMYGNEIQVDKTVKVTNEPVYFVYN